MYASQEEVACILGGCVGGMSACDQWGMPAKAGCRKVYFVLVLVHILV